MTRARLGCGLVGALLVASLLGGCGNDDADALEPGDEPGFDRCTEAAGAPFDEGATEDRSSMVAFFSRPEVLDCAIDRLDDERRRTALAAVFGEALDTAQAQAQLDALERWAEETAASASQNAAIDRAAALVPGLAGDTGSADADAASETKSRERGTAERLAFLLDAATTGEQPAGYETFVADNADAVKDPRDFINNYLDLSDDPAVSRIEDLADQILSRAGDG